MAQENVVLEQVHYPKGLAERNVRHHLLHRRDDLLHRDWTLNFECIIITILIPARSSAGAEDAWV